MWKFRHKQLPKGEAPRDIERLTNIVVLELQRTQADFNITDKTLYDRMIALAKEHPVLTEGYPEGVPDAMAGFFVKSYVRTYLEDLPSDQLNHFMQEASAFDKFGLLSINFHKSEVAKATSSPTR